MIVIIAIAVVVVAAVVVVVAATSRKENQSVGYLARETRQRDRAARKGRDAAPEETVDSRALERQVQQEQRGGGEVVKAEAAPLAPWVPPDEETIGVNRRQFLNRSIVGAFVVGLSGFGAGVIAFLWPQVSGGFGAKITVGKIPDVKAEVTRGGGFYYYPEGRMWITIYPASAIEKAKQVYSPPELTGMEAGLIALYQKCVHLGCRVPACQTSKWFECPCHGSQYNQAGEKKGGPAPRGLDRFAMSVTGGVFSVDTGAIILGPPIGTNTTGQEAEGPHCITGGGEHK